LPFFNQNLVPGKAEPAQAPRYIVPCYGAQELTCDLLPSFLDEIPNITAIPSYA
jgi:hypothetical protein